MLKIASNLELPESSVTKTFAIIAQRRKGKTYTANVLAEEMVKMGLPWVALDPTGAWWGLRSSADGKKAGLPVYVFGGDHGDLPLERTAGKMIADLVIEHPGWYVLDFSHFESKEAERQLATDFAERFYRRKGQNKTPMHLFVDEADMFAPQRTPAGDQRMLGAFESIVRRGGIRGIGTTLITQRAAVLNKNVLEQIDVLIALRTIGPNDRKAIAGYIEANGTPAQQAELMGSLASLELGEAWVWEPGEDLFKRVHIRHRRTFNSSATPDNSIPVVAKLAPVDLDRVREQMAATIERVEKDDPVALRRRIAELERQKPEPREVIREVGYPVEVGVMPKAAAEKINRLAGEITQLANSVMAVLLVAQPARPEPIAERPPAKQQEFSQPAKLRHTANDETADKLGKAERSILSVLAQYPQGRTVTQVAILAGYSMNGGGFRNALGALRSKGLIDGRDILQTTPAADAYGPFEALPTGRDLLAYWAGRLGKAERSILTTAYESYPRSLSLDEVAELTGYAVAGGGFRNALGKLRTLELISGRSEIKVAETLIEER